MSQRDNWLLINVGQDGVGVPWERLSGSGVMTLVAQATDCLGLEHTDLFYICDDAAFVKACGAIELSGLCHNLGIFYSCSETILIPYKLAL